ncbi:MAG: aminoglycoside phosphotransferase family protein, partial [Actinomycetota bacterium]|nr:aminoglycoside phosphotransferase family protein [Actinomycetota bacterium]
MRGAVLAAVDVGAAHGIEVSDPVLLHETNNTVVWLRPSPVVAKVATRADAKRDVRLEHAVA